ncbi:MAG TPA: prenyltransferase [Methanomassiliicoccales archaeon]|nr:prenyltransferase [Methanomassiliicoccales archaeon]
MSSSRSDQPGPYKDFKDLIQLARLHFLIPGLMLYALGWGLALLREVRFDAAYFLLGYGVFGLAQFSVNIGNDYFDRESDRFGVHTPVSGGSGVLLRRPELARTALIMTFAIMALSISTGAILTIITGYGAPYFLFILGGVLLGYFYTAPPLRLAYRGLGELTTAVAIRLIMPGMGYWTATGGLDDLALTFALPLFCYGVFFILTVELPDAQFDRLSGKRNLLSVYGEGAGSKVSLAATVMGTVGLLLVWSIYYKEMGTVLSWMVILSSVPLGAAIIGAKLMPRTRAGVLRQVRINFISMLSFLGLINLLIWVRF